MYKKILVPIDGSRTSKLGLNEAIQLAKHHKARLRLIYVVDVFVIMPTLDGGRNFDDIILQRHALDGRKEVSIGETLGFG